MAEYSKANKTNVKIGATIYYNETKRSTNKVMRNLIWVCH